jgi:hypothetical protein
MLTQDHPWSLGFSGLRGTVRVRGRRSLGEGTVAGEGRWRERVRFGNGGRFGKFGK